MLVRARKSLLTLLRRNVRQEDCLSVCHGSIHFVLWWDAQPAFFAVAFALIQWIDTFFVLWWDVQLWAAHPTTIQKILRASTNSPTLQNYETYRLDRSIYYTLTDKFYIARDFMTEYIWGRNP